jgi:hypothetical protein
VSWSHGLGWGGLGFTLVIGPIIGFSLGSPLLALVLAGLGVVSMVTGAILGQIGRGMQGRVI